ncbi:MAG TPA: sugar-binding protein [Polyangiaceae bacterium]|nr:sugar-binding protein [Polyangiaceae bacterium]
MFENAAKVTTRHRFPVSVAMGIGCAAALLLHVSEARSEPFTLVVLPDTQTEMTNTPQVKFPAMMQWIVDNQAARNIRFVVHVGDLVNWDTPYSDPPHFMYVNADFGFDKLDVAGIDYAIALGNHDTNAVGGKNEDGTACWCGGSAAPGDVHANLRITDTYNKFFPVSRFAACKGRFENAKMDNAYHTFSAGGVDWLVINTELDPRQGAVDWFNQIVAAHPNHNVVYVTHNFLSGSGTVLGGCGYGDLTPTQVWDQLLKVHGNMRFVLSGHVSSSALRQTQGDKGNTVYQMLTDWQGEGNGWLRTLEIDTAAKTVKAQTYSPYLKQYKTGPTDEFTLTGVDFIAPAAPPPQCSDGKDNDGDGKIDLADKGCAGAADDDESDDPPVPPKPHVVSLPAGAIQVDGDLGDWSGASWETLSSPKDYAVISGTAGDASDLSVKFASSWVADALYLAVEVTDDAHENADPAETMWRGDSLQVAFDVGRNGGAAYDTTDDYEFGWSLAGGAKLTHTWYAPAGSTSTPGPFAVVREGTKTRYEVRIDAAAIGKTSIQSGLVVGFGLLVNDNDGAGREGYVHWADGIGGDKTPESLGELWVVDVEPSDAGAGGSGGKDGGAGGAGGKAGATGSGGQGGAVTDAGVEPPQGGGGDSEEDGCGCSLVGGGPAKGSLLAALAALVVARRLRRSRRESSSAS